MRRLGCNCDRGRRRELALRFPRFVRWRDDRSPEEATTTAEVAAMFYRHRGAVIRFFSPSLLEENGVLSAGACRERDESY